MSVPYLGNLRVIPPSKTWEFTMPSFPVSSHISAGTAPNFHLPSRMGHPKDASSTYTTRSCKPRFIPVPGITSGPSTARATHYNPTEKKKCEKRSHGFEKDAFTSYRHDSGPKYMQTMRFSTNYLCGQLGDGIVRGKAAGGSGCGRGRGRGVGGGGTSAPKSACGLQQA